MIKILIADDLTVDRFLLRSLLNTLLPQMHITADIHEAECGTDAVEECRSTKYDIIFMDVIMPMLDGIQATKQIRAFETNAIIIGVSSISEPANQIEIIQNGANHFIEKPIYGDALLPVLTEVINEIKQRHKKH